MINTTINCSWKSVSKPVETVDFLNENRIHWLFVHNRIFGNSLLCVKLFSQLHAYAYQMLVRDDGNRTYGSVRRILSINKTLLKLSSHEHYISAKQHIFRRSYGWISSRYVCVRSADEVEDKAQTMWRQLIPFWGYHWLLNTVVHQISHSLARRGDCGLESEEYYQTVDAFLAALWICWRCRAYRTLPVSEQVEGSVRHTTQTMRVSFLHTQSGLIYQSLFILVIADI